MYTKTITTLAIASTLVLGAAAPALAKGRVERASGNCGSGSWHLKAKADNGGLEMEFEVDTNHPGQVWKVRVFDNGTRVVKTRRTTGGRSGSFSVERLIRNRAGSDAITARATRISTGKVCGGSVTF